MGKWLLFVLVFIFSHVSFAQAPKDTVYILLKYNNRKNNTEKSEKYSRTYFGNKYVIFKINKEEFYTNKETSIDTLSFEEAQKINYSDITYLLERYKASNPPRFKHNIFDAIFIVERISRRRFLKYQVHWNDEALGIIE